MLTCNKSVPKESLCIANCYCSHLLTSISKEGPWFHNKKTSQRGNTLLYLMSLTVSQLINWLSSLSCIKIRGWDMKMPFLACQLAITPWQSTVLLWLMRSRRRKELKWKDFIRFWIDIPNNSARGKISIKTSSADSRNSDSWIASNVLLFTCFSIINRDGNHLILRLLCNLSCCVLWSKITCRIRIRYL